MLILLSNLNYTNIAVKNEISKKIFTKKLLIIIFLQKRILWQKIKNENTQELYWV